MIDVPHEEVVGMKFNITAGVLARSKVASFERMLWRISKGLLPSLRIKFGSRSMKKKIFSLQATFFCDTLTSRRRWRIPRPTSNSTRLSSWHSSR